MARWPGLCRLSFPLTLIAQPQMKGDAEVLEDNEMRYGVTGEYHVRDALEESMAVGGERRAGGAVSLMATNEGEEGEGGGGEGRQPVHVAKVFSLDKPRNGESNVDQEMQDGNENDPAPGNTRPGLPADTTGRAEKKIRTV